MRANTGWNMLAELDPMWFRGIERMLLVLNVPLLLVIGYKLFLHGFLNTMTIEGSKESTRVKMTRVAPGTCCFVLAVILGIVLANARLKPADNSTSPSYLDGGSTGPVVTQLLDLGASALAAVIKGDHDATAIGELRRRVKRFPNASEVRNLTALERRAKAGTKEDLANLAGEKMVFFR